MKSGVDYFPLDVRLDSKIENIEDEFGITGFGIVVKLLMKIYREQGYYVEWSSRVASSFARRECFVGCDVVREVVAGAIREGIFDKEIFEKYGVLTSRGIQKRYFEIAKRRAKIEVKNEYLLVDHALISKNACNSSENVDISDENANIFEQSKVEESKVKESKVNIYEEARGCAREGTTPTKKEIQAYIKEKGYKSMTAERFISYCKDHGGIPDAWRERLDSWEANDINNPKENHDSFDTKDFFEAALRKSYREMGCEEILDL